jgi:hypothetical protein
MAINKKEAIQLILNTISDDMGIDESSIIEKEYGWVFFPQSKRYLETGNWRDMLIGSGGDLVEKETGRIISFGSAYSIEKNLKIYELGYLKHDNWDMVINKIWDEPETILQLMKLRATYDIQEVKDGGARKISKTYTANQFKELIKKLPFRLNIGRAFASWEELEAFKNQNYFTYELQESQSFFSNS